MRKTVFAIIEKCGKYLMFLDESSQHYNLYNFIFSKERNILPHTELCERLKTYFKLETFSSLCIYSGLKHIKCYYIHNIPDDWNPPIQIKYEYVDIESIKELYFSKYVKLLLLDTYKGIPEFVEGTDII
jgi:hypothetical protein